MHTRAYAAYGGYLPTAMDTRTAYAGNVLEVELPWYLLSMRFYVPWLRRFISPDAASPFDTGGCNRYAYCSGDPVNRIDPSGNASFGWLGKLLGNVVGMVGNAVGKVSHVTPTTALSTLGAVADVVAVGASIAAVSAAAMEDAPTAGILGWIAAGTGLAGLGLGAAGQAISKRPPTDAVSRGDQDKGLFGRSRPRPVSRYVQTLGNGQLIESVDGKGVVDLPELKNRIGRRGLFKKVIKPEWQVHPSPSGGLNYMADTLISDRAIYDFVQGLDKTLPKDQPLDILLGVHGSFYGHNWKWSPSENASVRQLGFEDWTFNQFATYLMENPIDREIRLHDLANLTESQLEPVVMQGRHVVHGYCFGAVDPKVVQWLNIAGTQRSYRL